MITASHNPPVFNGYKIKSQYGGSADAATCQAVEKLLDRQPGPDQSPGRRYQSQADQDQGRPARPLCGVKQIVDFKCIAKSGLRFAHDALFGVGAGCFEELLAGTTCRVTTLNAAA